MRFIDVTMDNTAAFVYQWIEDDATNELRGYGLAASSSRSVCIRVRDYTPYFYVSNADIGRVREFIGSYLIHSEVIVKRSLYGYVERSYVFCQFRSRKHLSISSYILRSKANITDIFETSASSVLQMTSLRSIGSVGWVRYGKCKSIPSSERMTRCDDEVNVRWRSLEPVVDIETIPHPKRIAFDLEVNSTIENTFPCDRPDDVIFQISCVVDDGRMRRSYLMCLSMAIDLDDIGADITVMRFDDEKQLILGFCNFINDEKPNVICGYNILGFDIAYLIKRAQRYLITSELQKVGFNDSLLCKVESVNWSSSAVAQSKYEYITWEGIVIVDLHAVIRRDYKFDNYKLDTVTHELLGAGKDPVSVKEIFAAYRSNVYARVGRYCVRDSDLCIDLMDHLKSWIALVEMAKVCKTSMFALYTQGQQQKIYNQVYYYCLRENIVVDGENRRYVTAAADERYVGAHVIEPVPGLYRNVVPFDFSSLYPSIIIAYNICYSTLVSDDDDERGNNVFEWEDHLGCEHDPRVIEKNRLTLAIDAITAKSVSGGAEEKRRLQEPMRERRRNIVASIGTNLKRPMCSKRRYVFSTSRKGVIPTIIDNLLQSRRSIRKQLAQCTDERLRIVLDKQQLAYKISANSMYGAMGVKAGYLPFMPGAMCVTYTGRRCIEDAARHISSIGGRVIYGDTDSNYVVFDDTTVEDLWSFSEYVATTVSDKFPRPMKLEFENVIYDRFLILSKKRYMYTRITDRNSVCAPTDAQMGNKGVLLSRRDNCRYVRTVYGDVAHRILHCEAKSTVVDVINNHIDSLYRRRVVDDDLVITKSVKDLSDMSSCEYKLKSLPDESDAKRIALDRFDGDERAYALSSCPAHVQLAERMRKRGTPVDGGSRIEFVVVNRRRYDGKSICGTTLAVKDKLEDFDYFTNHRRHIPLDLHYYAGMLVNPLQQLLAVIGEKDTVACIVAYRMNYDLVVQQLRKYKQNTTNLK